MHGPSTSGPESRCPHSGMHKVPRTLIMCLPAYVVLVLHAAYRAAVSHLPYIFTFLLDVAHWHTDQTWLWLWRLPLVLLIAAGQIAKLR